MVWLVVLMWYHLIDKVEMDRSIHFFLEKEKLTSRLMVTHQPRLIKTKANKEL